MKGATLVGMTADEAKLIQTEVLGTSFRVATSMRRCVKCSTDKMGTCNHVDRLRVRDRSLCELPYSYQCLFCEHLRISNTQADADRFTEWMGISNIPGVTKDRFGNPQGSQYDLAKDGGFKNKEMFSFACIQVKTFRRGFARSSRRWRRGALRLICARVRNLGHFATS